MEPVENGLCVSMSYIVYRLFLIEKNKTMKINIHHKGFLLKCSIQCFVVYSQDSVTITII